MHCPFCPGTESHVVDSRLVAEGKATRRRRQCEACQRRFTTYERVEHHLPTVLKKNGTREPFSRDKLVRSLRVACDKRSVSLERLDEVAASVEFALAESAEREVSSQAIGQAALEALRSIDEVAYVRFASVYRSFKDVDDFLAEMSKLVRKRSND